MARRDIAVTLAPRVVRDTLAALDCQDRRVTVAPPVRQECQETRDRRVRRERGALWDRGDRRVR